MKNTKRIAKRRGAQIEPPNRFESAHHEPDLDHLQLDPESVPALRVIQTEFIPDRSHSIVSENNSPDLPFRFSINPYRGCEHGCSYCYARPTHETLGMNAGLDFETKIMVKARAADLLRDELSHPSWKPLPICLSGVTDCYQPAERKFQLTRACLEVLLEARQPVMIVTKNALITRDLPLLRALAARQLVRVAISVTTLNPALAHSMEPRTSTPDERLHAIRSLSQAGIPVRVLVAPIIPGLTDSEMPEILRAAGDAGAHAAGYTMLRLPGNVQPVFLDWLDREFEHKRDRIEALVRSIRGGRLNDSQFGARMRGRGEFANQINRMFRVFSNKFGLGGELPDLDSTQFRAPRSASGQLSLF
jgi:DNA repair photolyase